MHDDHCIQDTSLSLAWGRAVKCVQSQGRQIVPLIVMITDLHCNPCFEDTAIRSALDKILATLGKQTCHSVANTIFPISMWNPHAPRQELFARYEAILPSIRRASVKNRYGTYFQRMIAGPPSEAHKGNQLDFIIQTYTARRAVRRSVLQVALFDSVLDHTTAAQRGFPCLQQISFAPYGDGLLAVNAFYAVQYMMERAYGNYLGLIHLGQFMAHELRLTLARVTCFTGIAQGDLPLTHLGDVLGLVDRALDARAAKGRN